MPATCYTPTHSPPNTRKISHDYHQQGRASSVLLSSSACLPPEIRLASVMPDKMHCLCRNSSSPNNIFSFSHSLPPSPKLRLTPPAASLSLFRTEVNMRLPVVRNSTLNSSMCFSKIHLIIAITILFFIEISFSIFRVPQTSSNVPQISSNDLNRPLVPQSSCSKFLDFLKVPQARCQPTPNSCGGFGLNSNLHPAARVKWQWCPLDLRMGQPIFFLINNVPGEMLRYNLARFSVRAPPNQGLCPPVFGW